MGWGGARGVILIAAITALIAPAAAQVTPLDIFGGLLGAAQARAAREAWGLLSNTDRFCLDRALARRNTDIAGLIQSGIGPDDRRLSSSLAECRRFTEPNLRRGFSCTTPDENGWSVSTTCNQTFAYRDGNDQIRSVEPREAIELHFSGTRVIVAEVEAGEARELRQTRAQAQSRAEQLQLLKTTLANYQRDASPVVRAEAGRIQARIEQQLAARTGPSAPDTDTIGREVGGLAGLSQSEAVRLSALDRMGTLRTQAEARTRADAPDALKKRLAELRKEVAAVSEPPRAAQPPKSAPTARGLGPSFDCEKASTPLPILICEDAGLHARASGREGEEGRGVSKSAVRSVRRRRSLALAELRAAAASIAARSSASARIVMVSEKTSGRTPSLHCYRA